MLNDFVWNLKLLNTMTQGPKNIQDIYTEFYDLTDRNTAPSLIPPSPMAFYPNLWKLHVTIWQRQLLMKLHKEFELVQAALQNLIPDPTLDDGLQELLREHLISQSTLENITTLDVSFVGRIYGNRNLGLL